MNQTDQLVTRGIRIHYLVLFFSFGVLFPFLGPYFESELQFSGTQIGFLLSLNPIVLTIAQPIWGAITDYTQKPRLLLQIALLGTAFTTITFLFVSSYWSVVIAYIVLSLIQSALVPISDSLAIQYATTKGLEYGSFRLWGAIGFAFSVLIMGFITDQLGLQSIFIALILILLIAFLNSKVLPAYSAPLAAIQWKVGLARLLKMPQYLLFLLINFMIFGPIYANNSFFGFLILGIGGSLASLGWAFFLAAGSEAPFMKVAGTWIQRYGVMTMMIAAAAIATLRWGLYAFQPSLLVIFLLIFLQGFSTGLFIPASIQFVFTTTPREVQATAIAVYSAVGNGLGTWFCSLFGGWLYENYSIGTTYLFFTILSAVGLILLFVLRKCYHESKEDLL